VLLACEGATLTLIVVVSAVVLVRLTTGHGPLGQHIDLGVVRVPHGTGPSGVALAAVFAFLSFVGFEASGTLGEEARSPRRDIPRAILGTVLGGGLFYTVVSAVEVWGFGTSAAGVASLASTPSLLGHLGSTYVDPAVGDVITAGTVVSAFGSVTASTVGASRLLYALSRDVGGARAPLARLHPRWGTPTAGVSTVVAATGVIAALLWFALRAPALEGLSDWPAGSAAWLPAISGAWLLVGLAAVVISPGLARRIGTRLSSDEGLVGDGGPRSDERAVVSPRGR